MIEDYRFGSMRINDRTYTGDLKIVRGAVVSGWWRKEGHVLDVEDVDDILAARPNVLVVGMGKPGRMQVAEALRSVLSGARIELIEVPTDEAVPIFNRLHAGGSKVAGAFHLTC